MEGLCAFFIFCVCVISHEKSLNISLLRIFQRDIIEFFSLTCSCIHSNTMSSRTHYWANASVMYTHICTTHMKHTQGLISNCKGGAKPSSSMIWTEKKWDEMDIEFNFKNKALWWFAVIEWNFFFLLMVSVKGILFIFTAYNLLFYCSTSEVIKRTNDLH